MAINSILQTRRLESSTNLGYIFPVVIFLGLSYLFYQFLAAAFRSSVALRMGIDLGDYSTITPMTSLHTIIFVAMVPAFLTSILILVHLTGSGQWLNSIVTRNRMRALVVILAAFLISGDLFQYASWARAPEYSIVSASRQIREDLGEGVVLGGAYAAVLGMENDYPGKVFFEIPLRNPDYQQRVLDSGLTHLAMEAESIFGDIPISDPLMRENAPEFVTHLRLSQTYYVRGYYVRVYEIK